MVCKEPGKISSHHRNTNLGKHYNYELSEKKSKLSIKSKKMADRNYIKPPEDVLAGNVWCKTSRRRPWKKMATKKTNLSKRGKTRHSWVKYYRLCYCLPCEALVIHDIGSTATNHQNFVFSSSTGSRIATKYNGWS